MISEDWIDRAGLIVAGFEETIGDVKSDFEMFFFLVPPESMTRIVSEPEDNVRSEGRQRGIQEIIESGNRKIAMSDVAPSASARAFATRCA